MDMTHQTNHMRLYTPTIFAKIVGPSRSTFPPTADSNFTDTLTRLPREGVAITTAKSLQHDSEGILILTIRPTFVYLDDEQNSVKINRYNANLLDIKTACSSILISSG